MENDNQEDKSKVVSIRSQIYKSILARGEETPNPDELAQREGKVISLDPAKREEQKKREERQKILDIIIRDTKSF